MTNKITALSIVKTLPEFESADQFGALRVFCKVEGVSYHGFQFYNLTEKMTPYVALNLAAEKMLASIAN